MRGVHGTPSAAGGGAARLASLAPDDARERQAISRARDRRHKERRAAARRLWAGWGWLGGEPKPCRGRAERRCRELRAVGVASTCALVRVSYTNNRDCARFMYGTGHISWPIILDCVKCKTLSVPRLPCRMCPRARRHSRHSIAGAGAAASPSGVGHGSRPRPTQWISAGGRANGAMDSVHRTPSAVMGASEPQGGSLDRHPKHAPRCADARGQRKAISQARD